MNDQTPEKPTRLTIDVEQWKRDIQTFADTTSRALNAIAAELSNECSTGRFPRDTSSEHGDSDFGPVPFGNHESAGEQRLEKLKSQLADRISKSN